MEFDEYGKPRRLQCYFAVPSVYECFAFVLLLVFLSCYCVCYLYDVAAIIYVMGALNKHLYGFDCGVMALTNVKKLFESDKFTFKIRGDSGKLSTIRYHLQPKATHFGTL